MTTSRLPVRILVRTGVDWAAMDRATLAGEFASEAPSALVRFLVNRSALDVWDEAYQTDFFEFRRQLREVAESNLAAVGGARISRGFDDWSWYDGDEDEMIYPVDDADYFHPELAVTAPTAGEPVDIVAWPHGQYHYDERGRPQARVLAVPTLFSNNWGIRKSFLRANFDEDSARRVLADHAAAARAVADHLGIERAPGTKWFEVPLRGGPIRHLESPYGISLKHVGSLLTLSAMLGDEAPVARLRAQQLAAPAPIDEELAWCERWVRAAEEVFRTCVPSDPGARRDPLGVT